MATDQARHEHLSEVWTMNCLIIYKSIHHGNTKQVAEAIAEELSAESISVDDLNPATLEQYDVIGLGSGIYMGKHHRSLLSFVGTTEELHGKRVFIFYTSGFGKFPSRPPFETSLRNALEAAGASVIGVFACRGFETWGPFRLAGGINKGHPTDEDLAKAREFAGSLPLGT